MRVEFNNQIHWSSQQPAGSFSVEFGTFGLGSVEFDFTPFTPATTATDDGIVGVTDGDTLVGIDTDLALAPNTGLANAVGSYVTPAGTGPDSVGLTIPMNTAIPVLQFKFVQVVPGEWALVP